MEDNLKITDAEWKIMRVLWSNNNLELSGIIRELKDEGINWSNTTIFTLVSRLVKKGAVHAEKTNKRARYSAAVGADECILQESKSFLDKVFGGSAGLLVASFIKSNTLSEEEIKELQHLLNSRMEGQND